MQNTKQQKKKIVVLGGGTGTFTVLTGLKYHDVELNAIVSIADDGGSTGRLRDELGVLPPGDIRQSLTALAEGDEVMRRLMNFRFSDGGLMGHNFGNLLLSALQKLYGSPESAIKMAHKILRVRGRVIPVSAQASTLYAELEDMSVVEGEHAIDLPVSKRSPIRRCFLDPQVMSNPDAEDAIRDADAIVLGPGDLHTSLIPVLLVGDITKAMAESGAKIIFVMNLVSKKAQTDGYSSKDFLKCLSQYLSPATVNTVIVNSQEIPTSLLERYTEAGEHPIKDDFDGTEDFEILRANILSGSVALKVKGDQLKRSLLRHDSEKLAQAIITAL